VAVLTDKGRRRRRLRGEANTFKLPTGEPLRRELVKAFRRQRSVVLEFLRTGRKQDRPGLPDAWPPLDDFGGGALPMAQRMTPLLKLTWSKAAAKFAPRVGLDPDEWSVVNPHTAAVIEAAALTFCERTNATTSLALDQALKKTREELHAGVVEQGESLEKLTKRVGRIFDGAETWRARRIAQSETSRAVHAAQEQAAVQSGVVRGWEWLLSSDACPECLAVAEKARFVKLGQPFAVTSPDPVYGAVKFPPLHPHCACSVLEVLDTDPEPAWSQTLTGSDLKPTEPKPAEPDPKPDPKPAPKPKRPKPTPAPRKRKPKPYAPGVVEPAEQVVTLAGTPEDVEKAADTALKAMATLHGMPAEMGLNRLKVRDYRPEVDDRRFKGKGFVFGFYSSREDLVTTRTEVAFAGHTLAHEFGHWIDATISRRAKREVFDGVNPDLAQFDAAVRKSKTVAWIEDRLDKWREKLKRLLKEKARLEEAGKGDEDFWKEYNKRIELAKDAVEYAEYLLSPEELWARAYSFWVCRDGGSAALKKDLADKRTREGENSPHHWTAEDFKPVEAEIKAVFDKLGWTRRTPPMTDRDKHIDLDRKADDDKRMEAVRKLEREFRGAPGRGEISDIIRDRPRVDRRTLQEIADGVAPYYD